MRNILFGVCTVALGVLVGGCVSSGPAPQDVQLQSPDGRAVIIKDIYELPALEHTQLSKTDIVKVFFPDMDNIKTNFSITLLKIPSGTAQAKHKQTSSQIIYAISGGGKLVIDNNMIILKKGIMVYIPANAAMAITNNVVKPLELIVVTSPPFKPSQLTVLSETPPNVKVAVDPESKMEDEPADIQAVSEKYKAEKKIRTLSVEEYRSKLNKTLPPIDEKNPMPDLLETTKKSIPEVAAWPLKMPDSNKVPLKTLEKEQIDMLLPQKPEKIEDTSTKNTTELTPEEQAVPTSDDNTRKAAPADSRQPEKEKDPLQKLLDDQKKHEENLIPKAPLKVKKTSLQHVQELSPTENAVPTKSTK